MAWRLEPGTPLACVRRTNHWATMLDNELDQKIVLRSLKENRTTKIVKNLAWLIQCVDSNRHWHGEPSWQLDAPTGELKFDRHLLWRCLSSSPASQQRPCTSNSWPPRRRHFHSTNKKLWKTLDFFNRDTSRALIELLGTLMLPLLKTGTKNTKKITRKRILKFGTQRNACDRSSDRSAPPVFFFIVLLLGNFCFKS